MRLITGTLLVAALLGGVTACGGGSTPSQPSRFASTVQHDYASTVSATGAATAKEAASAWQSFAVQVEVMNAGPDSRKQGLIVAMAKQAAAAYRSQLAAIRCAGNRYVNGGPTCPPSQGASGALRELRALVDSL